MGRSKKTFLQKRYTDSLKAHGKVINIAKLFEKCKSKLQGITSQWSEWLTSRSLQIISAAVGVEKTDPSYTVGGTVNWYSHYGEQYGVSLKN